MKFATVGIVSLFIFCILLLIYIPVNSCNTIKEEKEDLKKLQLPKETLRSHTIEIVEIDSCEYILLMTDFHLSLTHKGNCKYCLKRNLK